MQCLLVLDNPRQAVYNKDKERRCPCKRLAPHQLVKKNDRHGLRDVGRSFLFVVFAIIVRNPPYNIKRDMYGLKQKRQQADDQGQQSKDLGKTHVHSSLRDERWEVNFKKRPPVLISFQRNDIANR